MLPTGAKRSSEERVSQVATGRVRSELAFGVYRNRLQALFAILTIKICFCCASR